jgi:hypothetical protein
MSEEIERFFAQKVPNEWFVGTPVVDSDDEEILVTGVLPAGARVDEFRESTRAKRMVIADQAQSRFGRKVSWGAQQEGVTTVFTSQSTPVMTRLRLRERAVLDTLIEGGLARSRSEALAWCVKLVAIHQADWLAELREALTEVKQVRAEGPTLI